MIHGKLLFIFKEKLKRLKVSLKNWNNFIFGRYNLAFEDAILELRKLDDLVSSDPVPVLT